MVPEKLTFSPLVRRQIEADFSGGHITSDAGLLLLREVDKQHRLTRRLASVLQDPRTPEMVRHRLDTMVRQRVFGVRPVMKTSMTTKPCALIRHFKQRLARTMIWPANPRYVGWSSEQTGRRW
jgi:hypothetical protein